jgi:hypothetical protein
MPSVGVVHDRMITGMARGYANLDWSALGLIAAEEAGLRGAPQVAATGTRIRTLLVDPAQLEV